MAIEIRMPRQGQSVESCIITKLYVEEGSQVSEGDILFAYETDKASFEYESEHDGILLRWLFSEGEEVPVLETVCLVGEEGEDRKKAPDHELKISPRARKMAKEKGIDISRIKGSGPGGRIIVRDLEGAEAGGTATGQLAEMQAAEKDTGQLTGMQAAEKASGRVSDQEDYHDEPLSNIRKIIARSMHQSLQNSAQLTHHLGADARKLLAARQKIKEAKENEGFVNISINDLVCYAVIKSLQKHPRLNSQLHDEKLRLFSNVNLGLAVDTDRGLMVPVIEKADTLTISEFSKKAADLATQCRQGAVDPDMLRPEAGSFTVSNLGNYGVEMFTPVINLPQTAILGVNTIVARPVDLGGGAFGFVPYIGLSLTYDHRALDGAEATRFLMQLAEEIKNIEIN